VDSSGEEVLMHGLDEDDKEDIPVMTLADWLNERVSKQEDIPKTSSTAKASRYEKVSRGDFRFFDPFVDDEDGGRKYPAARVGLIVADETNTVLHFSDSLRPIDQRVVMSEADIQCGKEHVRKKQLRMKVFSWPPSSGNNNVVNRNDGLSIPKEHAVVYTTSRAFPDNAKYEECERIECPIRRKDEMKWSWSDPEVKYHTFLMQVSDEAMTTTYGHCFRWCRPCLDPKLEGFQGPVALIVLSPFIMTETVRRRILRLPLRNLFDGANDEKALRDVWRHALNIPIDSSLSSIEYV